MVEKQICKRRRKSVEMAVEFKGRMSSIAHDLSQSGMRCRTSRQIEEMTLVDIRFALPATEDSLAGRIWVECGGVVVSCRKKGGAAPELPYELSIFFNTISEESRNLLSDYIAR